MKEIEIGKTHTIEFGEHVVIGFDKKFLKFNDGKQIEFHAKINECGKIVLESEFLAKLSKTGVNNDIKR